MQTQVPYEIVFGQEPKVGINGTRISQELRSRLWKEDELLQAIGLADRRFLDGDANDDTMESHEDEGASDLGDGVGNADELPEEEH